MEEYLRYKQVVAAWLEEYGVENYTLVSDPEYGWVVDVVGDVDLNDKGLSSLQVKFNHVSGTFYCFDNNLTTLEYCPVRVDGHFYCNNNQLKSLEHCPEFVGGHFNCSGNELTTLEFLPQSVGRVFLLGTTNPLFNKYSSIDKLDTLKLKLKADEEAAMLSTALTNGKLPLVHKL